MCSVVSHGSHLHEICLCYGVNLSEAVNMTFCVCDDARKFLGLYDDGR
jgi:hypothetical protein